MKTLLVGLAPLAILAIYFLPSLYALGKKKKHVSGITILNLFLGWTFIGWVAALVWASSDEQRIESEK